MKPSAVWIPAIRPGRGCDYSKNAFETENFYTFTVVFSSVVFARLSGTFVPPANLIVYRLIGGSIFAFEGLKMKSLNRVLISRWNLTDVLSFPLFRLLDADRSNGISQRHSFVWICCLERVY